MKAALALVGCLFFGAAFSLASEADTSRSLLTQTELFSTFSSPIKLGPEETDLYNPEDLSALLFLKPSIDIFSLGPFGQKRGFSNWGRIGKGEELLYDGQARAPIYLNYPQSSEIDLTPLQFEHVDSVSFFDHPLASFLFGAQAPASAYLHTSSAETQQPLVSARLKKRSSGQSTAIVDLQRPLGKRAFARGVGSFKNKTNTGLNDHTEVQSYHLSFENPAGSKNHWKGGYELDRELGGIIPFTGISDPALGKNFRKDVFFFNMDGRLSTNTKVEADFRYQRTDQKILSSDTTLRRRAEERRPFFGIALSRELNRSFFKLYGNADATILDQHPGRADDWRVNFGGVWAAKLDNKTIFSMIGQISETRLESPKPEGWVGLSRSLWAHQTVFVTASSQVIYPSVFDRYFERKAVPFYIEFINEGPPERIHKLNFTYKLETKRFACGISLVAERSDNYLTWEDISFIGSSTTIREPSYRNVKGGGAEFELDFKFVGQWKGGYAYRNLVDREGNYSLPLSSLDRAYFRWTTPKIKPIKALSIQLIPMVNYFYKFQDDIVPYKYNPTEAFVVNLKAIAAVENFNFFYSVENLFDRQYFLRGSLPQPGRSYFLGFNWHLWN